MKKIMFMLAFVGIGLFASAGNGKVGKGKLLVKAKMGIKAKKQLEAVPMYSVTVNCGGGHVYTACCFTSAVADAFGNLMAEILCV